MSGKEKESSFEKYIQNMSSLLSPKDIARMSPEHRANLLATPEERLEYMAGDVGRTILQSVTTSFSSEKSERDNIINLISVAGDTTDSSYSTPKAKQIRKLLQDPEFLSDFYSEFDIDKDFIDFDYIAHSSDKHSRFKRPPDRTGFDMVMEHSKKASTIELNERTALPEERTSKSELERSYYSEGEFPDLTGLSFLHAYVTNLRPHYLNSLSKGDLELSYDETSTDEIEQGQTATMLPDKMQQMQHYHAGLSYEGTLLAIHFYEEIIGEFMEKHYK